MIDLTNLLLGELDFQSRDDDAHGFRVPSRLRENIDRILRQRGVPLVEAEAADADDADDVYQILLELVERVIDSGGADDPDQRVELERAARLLRKWLQQNATASVLGLYDSV